MRIATLSRLVARLDPRDRATLARGVALIEALLGERAAPHTGTFRERRSSVGVRAPRDREERIKGAK